jgi:hypothetical protein
MLLTIILGAIIFQYTHFKIGDDIKSLNWKNAIYYTIITFTTVGYGDIVPVGVSKIISGIIGVIGIFVMSSFSVSLVKKYIELYLKVTNKIPNVVRERLFCTKYG